MGGLVNGEWTIPIVDRDDIGVLRRIGSPVGGQPWPALSGPFKMAQLVPALDGAKVDEWLEWTDGDATDFASGWRGGASGWACDLGSRPGESRDYHGRQNGLAIRVGSGLRLEKRHRVRTFLVEDSAGIDPWNNAEHLDMGRALLNGINLTSTAATYLLIAGVFLFVYYLVAGPGKMYLLLATRKRAQFSWFAFALAAIVATGLTVVLIKLVVRGPPRLRRRHRPLCRG